MVFNLSRSGGGGSGGLNYTLITSDTRPSAAAENTIWVESSVPANGWQFSADEPTSPVEGMLWISVGTVSQVAFSVSAVNPVWVYPIDCEQYVNGAWVNRNAQSYLNGEWVEWTVPVEIYPGVSYNAYNWYFGPGIDTSKDKNVQPTVTNSGTTVRVSVSNAYDSTQGTYPRTSGVAVSSTAVDLTGCKKVEVTYESKTGSGNVGFWINTTNQGGAPAESTGRLVYVTEASGKAVIQPGTELSGTYYFGIGVRTTSGGSATSAVTVTLVVAK